MFYNTHKKTKPSPTIGWVHHFVHRTPIFSLLHLLVLPCHLRSLTLSFPFLLSPSLCFSLLPPLSPPFLPLPSKKLFQITIKPFQLKIIPFQLKIIPFQLKIKPFQIKIKPSVQGRSPRKPSHWLNLRPNRPSLLWRPWHRFGSTFRCVLEILPLPL